MPDHGFSEWVHALRRERMTAKSATEKLARRSDDEREYDDGDRIVAEGDSGREMFVVAAGRVRISKAADSGEVTLGFIERGEFFGEMSLLESLPRYASAYAVGPTRVVVIEPGGLMLRVRQDPTLALEMLKHLSSRLRVANSWLVESIAESTGEQPPVPVWERFDEDDGR